MASISQATCRIHFERVASARCLGCQLFYCSECITEHRGKLTCAACLDDNREVALRGGASNRSSNTERRFPDFQLMPVVQLVFGLIVVWLIFYLVAQTLTQIPDVFHDGTIWE